MTVTSKYTFVWGICISGLALEIAELNGFIKWLNFEIQTQWVTFRCYLEDFGILIRRPEGKWRNSSCFLKKHLPMVTEQVCGTKGSLDYFGLGFPSLSCPLSFALLLHFVLLVWQTGCTTGCTTLPGCTIGAVGCLRLCVVRQKLLGSFCKQSGNVHEWMRQRKSESLLFPSPSVKKLSGLSFWSSIIKNGNNFFSCAGESVFALSNAQGKVNSFQGTEAVSGLL